MSMNICRSWAATWILVTYCHAQYPELYADDITCDSKVSLGSHISEVECGKKAEANPKCTGNMIQHAGWYTSHANWQCYCCKRDTTFGTKDSNWNLWQYRSSPAPSPAPTPSPTPSPTPAPTASPSPIPTRTPSKDPTSSPTTNPTNVPTAFPTIVPSYDPTTPPTDLPTNDPTEPTHDPEECMFSRNISFQIKYGQNDTTNGTKIEEYCLSAFELTVVDLTSLKEIYPEWCVSLSVRVENEPVSLIDVLFSYLDQMSTALRMVSAQNISTRFAHHFESLSGIPISDVAVSSEFSIGNNIEEDEVWYDFFVTPIGITTLCILSIPPLIVAMGLAHQRYTGADDFSWSSVVFYAVYTLDIFSDSLFCIDIYTTYLSSNPEAIPAHDEYAESTMRLIITQIFGASVLFIVVPVGLNFVNLFQFQNKLVKTHDRYHPWFEDYMMFLFLLSLICGSTFSAVELTNSNLFGHRMFSMGLSKYDKMTFKQHRLWSVVVAENVPQLVIQIVFLTTVEGGLSELGAVSIGAMVSSLLSICAAVFEFVSKRALLDADINRCAWSTKVTSNDVKFTDQRKRFIHKSKCISKAISEVTEFDVNAVTILSIEPCLAGSDNIYGGKRRGLKINCVISTKNGSPEQILSILRRKQSHLRTAICGAWGLSVNSTELTTPRALQQGPVVSMANIGGHSPSLIDSGPTHITGTISAGKDSDDEGVTVDEEAPLTGRAIDVQHIDK